MALREAQQAELELLRWVEEECDREPRHARAALHVLVAAEKRRIAQQSEAGAHSWTLPGRILGLLLIQIFVVVTLG